MLKVLSARPDVPVHTYATTDLCELLGVPMKSVHAKKAPELRKHYRRMVLVLHPDKNPHERANEAFTAVMTGFEILNTILSKREQRDDD